MRGISVVTNAPAGAGTTLATVGTPGDPAFGGSLITLWPAGDTIGANVLAGPRMTFLSGSREPATPADIQLAGEYDLTAGGASLFLNAVAFMGGGPGFLPGDVDGINGVDLTDFDIIRNHFQQTATMRSEGDLNFDGFVDFRDFRIWKDNFPTPPPEGAGANVIPEPTSGLLLCWSIVSLLAMTTRRRRC
jgi:hypothetical protein